MPFWARTAALLGVAAPGWARIGVEGSKRTPAANADEQCCWALDSQWLPAVGIGVGTGSRVFPEK